MKELDEYHEKLLKRLGEAASEFRAACLAVRDPYQAIDGGWNVHQLAVHTRDVDQLVYGARARRTAAEENPLFANFDGDTYMAQQYDPNEPLAVVLDALAGSVRLQVRQLAEMPPEGWARTSRHETQGGGFTVQTWIGRNLHHIEEHLATVRKSLGDGP